MKHLVISGSAFERGKKVGSLFKAPTLKLYNNELAHINLARSEKIKYENALQFIKPYISVIEKELPELALEVEGMGVGLGLSYEEAMLFQLRRELLNAGMECSLFASRRSERGGIISQNVDLPGNLLNQFQVLQHNTKDTNILQLSHYGLLCFLGMNNKGLAIGINMVLAKGWRPGVPPYLLVRHLLSKESVEECVAELERIPRSSSRCFTILDSSKLACVEMTVDSLRVTYQQKILHTNHYLHEDFKAHDLINRDACSFARLKTLRKLVESDEISIDQYKKILAYHAPEGALCLHADSPQSPHTVASVLMHPAVGKMNVALGNPCNNNFEEYQIRKRANE